MENILIPPCIERRSSKWLYDTRRDKWINSSWLDEYVIKVYSWWLKREEEYLERFIDGLVAGEDWFKEGKKRWELY